MAVPYPPDGLVSYSQEMDYRVAVASRVIQAAIDELPNWEIISERLAGQLGLNLEIGRDRALVQDCLPHG